MADVKNFQGIIITIMESANCPVGSGKIWKEGDKRADWKQNWSTIDFVLNKGFHLSEGGIIYTGWNTRKNIQHWLQINSKFTSQNLLSNCFSMFKLHCHLSLVVLLFMSKYLVCFAILLAQRLECSPMARETWVQSQVESYQRL